MSAHIRLVVGLGNPGERYRNTWHNLGARAVEVIARRAGLALRPGKGEFLCADLPPSAGSVTLLTPISYMNRSGGPVAAWLRYHKVEPGLMLVVYDDHDLPLGRIRLREEGSAGGHRGMEDIIRMLGADLFPRLRIGIETSSEHSDLADQVLAPITKKHQEIVERVIFAAADAVELAALEGVAVAMSRYNGVELS